MNNLYILTEERAKTKVIIEILKIYCDKYNKNMEKSQVKIIPEINNGKYSFNSYIKGIKIDGIKQIILSSASGKSSFVDYLVFEQSYPPKEESDDANNLLLLIEETKTSDKESRNTGVYQRSLKFTYADVFYPDVPKYMLYNIEGDENRKPTDTSVFGTNMLLTQGVGIIGKDNCYFDSFKDIDEVMKFKNNMRAAPKGNVPIEITQDNDIIEISGRLYKSGGIAHDPNMGCLSSIAKTLRVLGWKGKIKITQHGLNQQHIDTSVKRSHKFLNIAKCLDIQFDGLNFDGSNDIPKKYWYYEKKSEKIGTIFLHLLAVSLNNSVKSIYENHAGCERGYFYSDEGKGIALPKKDQSGVNNLLIPDLILLNNETKEILVIEGKKSSTLERGLEEINNYDSIENEYIKPEYPDYSISRWVTTFGEDRYHGNLNPKVLIHLNRDGSFYVNEKAPNWIKELFKDNVELFMRNVLKDEEELVVDH